MTPNHLPTQPGTPFAGGYLVGIVDHAHQRYALIVSPIEGELEGCWHEQYRTDVPGAISCFDGHLNTIAMAEGGSNLAKAALALDINGFRDWYLPARDELELLYRHLKPTEDHNTCSFRDGDNPSSVPAGYPYTEEAPAQTSALDFQQGGAQALQDVWYWSSTQYSANDAWTQHFDGGNQFNDGKVYQGRARAVRKFLIP